MTPTKEDYEAYRAIEEAADEAARDAEREGPDHD